MRLSPRERRLHSDFRAVQELRQESSIFDFEYNGNPADYYKVIFHGNGIWRPQHATEVEVIQRHEVQIKLTAAYPRMIPELHWLTPIFHPNISAGGVVCLGGYGTHWVPSLKLDELCHMLWDMIRYKNFDIQSPYNREAALWARDQRVYELPLDNRQLRNRIDRKKEETPVASKPPVEGSSKPPVENSTQPPVMDVETADDDIEFIDAEVVDRTPTDDGGDIMFIE